MLLLAALLGAAVATGSITTDALMARIAALESGTSCAAPADDDDVAEPAALAPLLAALLRLGTAAASSDSLTS